MTQVIIQAVPWEPRRAAHAAQLMDQLPGSTIVWDRQRSGYLTYLDVLREAGDLPVIIIEDDTYVGPGFLEKAQEVIAEHPTWVINFFSHGPQPSGVRTGDSFAFTVGHYLPAGTAKAMLHFAPLWEWDGDIANQDYFISDFLNSRGENYWLEVPNIVDHLPFTSVVDPRRSIYRQSHTFQDFDA